MRRRPQSNCRLEATVGAAAAATPVRAGNSSGSSCALAIGTRYRQTRSVPQPSTEALEITGLKPNQLIEIQGTLAQFSAQLSYHLLETHGGTELANTMHLEPQRSVRFIAPVLVGRIKRAVGDNLNELRTRLEA